MEIKENESKNDSRNLDKYIINPNQNKYDTPKKLLPMYDPYQSKNELPPPPKVQPPRQVLELEKLKGKSKLPDIQRTYSFTKKKFGYGNLDVVEPGELVSNIKLRLINQMLFKKESDSNIISKSTFKGQTQKNLKGFDLLSYTRKKYDSDNEDKKQKINTIRKRLTYLIKKVNNKKILSKIGKYFKKWKNPSKYIKNMPNFKGGMMLDCAPPPKQEKKSSTIPVVFLSKSLIKDTKPFYLEEEKNNGYKDDKNLMNIERINIGTDENKSADHYRKEPLPKRVKNGGRIEFVFPSQQDSDSKIKEDVKNNGRIKGFDEDEEEEEEEIEEEVEEISEK